MVKTFSVQYLEGYSVSKLKLKFSVYLQLTGHHEIVGNLKDLIDLCVYPISFNSQMIAVFSGSIKCEVEGQHHRVGRNQM